MTTQNAVTSQTAQSSLTIDYPIWKTIKLGTGLKTADDFRCVLEKAGYRISAWANDILHSPAFTASEVETEVELVVLTVEELGFKGGATWKDIYECAFSRGLALCPAEVGPQLRLQYKDQPQGEWPIVAMEPIADLDGELKMFGVAHDSDGQRLSARRHCYPDYFWLAAFRFVFVRRK